MEQSSIRALRNIPLLVFFCFIFLGTSMTSIGQKPVPQGVFLSLSDLHFDPFGFPGLTDTLLKSPVETWAGIFQAAAGSNSFGSYGEDTNYNLFLSALKKIKAIRAHPDFIVLTGDFLSHNFGATFQANTGILNTDTLFLFIHKTLQFTTEMLQSTFPGTTIFPVLGNNDSYCGDYQGETNDRFFEEMSNLWYPLVKNSVTEAAFKQSFRKGGFYAARNPADSTHLIIALNTIVYSDSYDSPKYTNYCNGATPDSAGMLQTAWLKKQLQDCRLKKKKVWLVYHIPPGINAYSSSSGNKGSCEASITGFLKDSFNQLFIHLIHEYQDVIQLSMAGHTHMDNFELFLDSAGTPYNFIHVTPAISPIFGNNPSFEEIRYFKGSATWKDYTCYYFKGFSQSGLADPWGKEYSFSQAYSEPSITAASLKRTFGRIYTDTVMRNNYIRYYNVSNTASPGIDAQTFPAYWCAMGAISAQQFAACSCQQQTTGLLPSKTKRKKKTSR